MKKLLLLLSWYILLMCPIETTAQAPQKMSYQMVVRNNTNAIVANQQVGVKISLLQSSATGIAVYEETHTPTTTANGLASLVIGDGTVVTGNIENINWANGPYFIKTETDPTGGTNYSITGTSQLLSVPYALYAHNIPKQGKVYIYLKGDISNADAAAIIARDAGPLTQFLIIDWTTNLTSIDISSINNLAELVITNNQKLASVQMSTLTSVDSKISVLGNNVLTQLSFPQLETFQGEFTIQYNNLLPGLTLPALTHSTGYLQISYNPKFTSINLPLCVQGSIISNSNPLITTLSFPLLASGWVSTSSTTNLTNVSLPNFVNGSVSISTCNSLTNLSLPQLISGGINIRNNSNLASISIPLFDSGSCSIESNQLLSSVSFPSYRVALDVTVSNNTLINSLGFPSLVSMRNATFRGNYNSLHMPLLKHITDRIGFESIGLLSVISLPELETAGSMVIKNCHDLTTVAFPKLKTCDELEMREDNGYFDQVSQVDLGMLERAGKISIWSNSLSFNILNLSQLNKADYLVISVGLNSLSLNSLDSTVFFYVAGVGGTLALPQLKVIRSRFYLTGVSSVSLPLLHEIGNEPFSGISLPFTPVNPTPTSWGGRNFQVSGNLSSSEVNALLAKLVSIVPPIANRSIGLRQFVAAPPTGQGLVDKAALQARPNNVATD